MYRAPRTANSNRWIPSQPIASWTTPCSSCNDMDPGTRTRRQTLGLNPSSRILRCRTTPEGAADFTNSMAENYALPPRPSRLTPWNFALPMVHGSRPVVWALRFFFMESFHLAGTDARLAEKRGSITPSSQGIYTPYLLPVRLAHRILMLPILARCSSSGKPSLETAFFLPRKCDSDGFFLQLFGQSPLDKESLEFPPV